MCTDIEHKLKKLITSEFVEEFGWVNNNKEFLIWVHYLFFYDFIKQLKHILGNTMFEETGYSAHLGPDTVCINLSDLVSCDVELEHIFPYEKYQH